MFQPTSLIRTISQINNCLKILIENNADSVWTVSKTDTKFHPDKQLLIKNKNLNFFSKKGDKIKARQELSETYYKNGECYAITRKCLLEKNSIRGDKCFPLIINEKTINFDTIGSGLNVDSLIIQSTTNKNPELIFYDSMSYTIE